MSEPKLLDADGFQFIVDACQTGNVEAARTFLAENGLIAEEPVDPALVVAREIASQSWEHEEMHDRARRSRRGELDGSVTVRAALAALRRGMELQREKLTRDVVSAAWEQYAVNGPYGADGLHTALLEKLDA